MKMEKLKVKFVDFWIEMNQPEGNYFYALLSEKYDVEFSDEPEILFYSNYGEDYLKYDCIRIFYSAENRRPNFTGCDFAITFDFNDRNNHFRFPLYGMYCKPELLLGIKSKDELLKEWRLKENFCCMVVSNGSAKKRIDFFHHLSKYRKVDSGGKYLNNIGGPVNNKLEFISHYKFVFAFENSSYPGYTTEKVIEPLQVNSIPIYWGNPLIERDINGKRIINYHDYKNEEKLIEDLLSIEADPDRAIDILCEPVFPGDRIPSYADKASLLAFLDHIIGIKDRLTPIAKTRKRIIHAMSLKTTHLKNLLNSKVFRNT
jgi:hypothetical protein